MNASTESTNQGLPDSAETRELVHSLARVGAAWARYGLGVAQMSVETSARTLDVAATALGTLASEFRKFAESEPKTGDPIDVPGEPRP